MTLAVTPIADECEDCGPSHAAEKTRKRLIVNGAEAGLEQHPYRPRLTGIYRSEKLPHIPKRIPKI